MVSGKPFNYHSGLWLLSSCVILSQTAPNSGNDSSEDSGKSLGKMIDFADLVKDIKSFAGFSPCRQLQVARNDVT